MNRRDFLCCAAGAVACSPWAVTAAAAGKRPPNVVLILVDDLGWSDLGAYGGRLIDTPRIDRLAGQGMQFSQAYANCPVCSPSRAALLTGQYPARLRFTGHITATEKHRHPEGSRIIPPADRMDLPLEEVTLAELFQSAGYATASMGKWHVGREGFWPKDQGFDRNIAGWTHGSPPSYFFPYTSTEKDWNAAIPTLQGGEEGEYLTDRLTDEAIRFLSEERDHPFFLYLSHYAVHTPLEAPQALVEKYRNRFSGVDTVIDPIYAAMVENLDQNTGRLLDALDEFGLAGNTLVVFFSDNGGTFDATTNAPLRQEKGTLYEGGIRVPLLIRWPGHIPVGAACTAPVIGSDLYATLAAAANMSIPDNAGHDSVNLSPLWSGGRQLERDALYWYYPHYVRNMPGAAMRRGKHKLIEIYDPPAIELYDLASDPAEQHNLVGEMPDLAEEMLQKLRQHIVDTGAILHTPNPAARGADTPEHQKEGK